MTALLLMAPALLLLVAVFVWPILDYTWLSFQAKSVFTDLQAEPCLLYTSPSPRDQRGSRMPSSA